MASGKTFAQVEGQSSLRAQSSSRQFNEVPEASAHLRQQLAHSFFGASRLPLGRKAPRGHVLTRQHFDAARVLTSHNSFRCSSVHVADEGSLETFSALHKSGGAKKGFHQKRFAASKKLQNLQQDGLAVQIREPTSDQELNAVAILRALSFYAYRPERAFAGKLHQKMKAKEEYERLLQMRENCSRPDQQEVCLAAFCRWDTVSEAPEELHVRSQDGEDLALIGSLDVCVTRSVQGEVLIGQSKHAAYLSNVCVSEAVRRRSVGRLLLEEARKVARRWGVESLYVHTLAVNEVAQRFYAKHGFVIEQEESSNEAHYRGHCLDGIEGRGRTVLLRDEMFQKVGP